MGAGPCGPFTALVAGILTNGRARNRYVGLCSLVVKLTLVSSTGRGKRAELEALRPLKTEFYKYAGRSPGSGERLAARAATQERLFREE